MSALPELKRLLETRIEVIEDTCLREENPELQLSKLKEVSEKIDLWKVQHSKSVDRKLQHYLENYSLQKALDHIS